jgi:hypothetical protein
LTILRSSFFGGVGGFVAVAEEVGGGESFGFSTLAEDARVIWFPARLRDCFCCLRVNELVVVAVEVNCLVKDCVANIMDEMVSLLKKRKIDIHQISHLRIRKRKGEREETYLN